MNYKRNYKYHTYNDNGVITTVCVANYKGQWVRAKAKCMPTDEYDAALGREIAKRRVDIKIAKKKLKNMLEAYNDNLIMRDALLEDNCELAIKIDKVRDFINVNEEIDN